MSRLSIFAFVLSILAIEGAFADPTSIKDSVPHITTIGSANVEVVPDQAEIALGISNENMSAEMAAQATAEAASRVIAEIKARGIDPRDIETIFELSAQYDEDHDEKGRARRVSRGYSSFEHINVMLRDVSKASALARDLIAKGANEFNGIYFSYSKEKETRKRLKADAIRDAMAEAKTYTDAIGVKLGRTLQIGNDAIGGDQADLPSRRDPMVKSAVVIPTEPGMENIRESVTVVWEIEGKAP